MVEAESPTTLAIVIPIAPSVSDMDRQQIIAIVFVLLMIGSSIIYGASLFF